MLSANVGVWSDTLSLPSWFRRRRIGGQVLILVMISRTIAIKTPFIFINHDISIIVTREKLEGVGSFEQIQKDFRVKPSQAKYATLVKRNTQKYQETLYKIVVNVIVIIIIIIVIVFFIIMVTMGGDREQV